MKLDKIVEKTFEPASNRELLDTLFGSLEERANIQFVWAIHVDDDKKSTICGCLGKELESVNIVNFKMELVLLILLKNA